MLKAFADMKIEAKKVLSIIRGGDYAHPGEEEAIELVFKPITKQRDRKILDVGCGLGGTAKYVQDHGWGRVTAIDYNAEMIEYAKRKYADIHFVCGDVVGLPKLLADKLNLFYLLNSFYSFPKQAEALKAMRQVADDNAELIIFDYVDRGGYQDPLLIKGDKPVLPYCIELDVFLKQLADANWKLKEIKDIDDCYERWYAAFMNHMEEKKEEIIDKAGQEAYDAAHYIYGGLLDEIRKGRLGGVIVYA